ncbi:N-acetyltransferase [Pseudovibrio sp. JE062]|uniref:GNAT family N-acetyltransferase n=1 Tax=Pseudovibrio sp. JE062 TaxID=439495 RepID=UPI000186C5CE|nr:GNAT family N-acetyltransferase [Pseudovibrio sp. JE062]EEA92091.1 acetyltransferase, GNAT family [Pseudovibrio sp. JE062]
MKTFEIRSARSKDISQIGTVGLASWKRGIGPHVPQVAHDTMSKASFTDFASACLDQIVVAVKEDRVLGFAATEHADNFITDLWIDPDYESSGLGTALVEEAERRIAARGYHTAEISVLIQNERALGLYHHMKYEDVFEATKFDEDLNCEITYIRLRKHLPFYAEEIA